MKVHTNAENVNGDEEFSDWDESSTDSIPERNDIDPTNVEELEELYFTITPKKVYSCFLSQEMEINILYIHWL